MDAKFSVNLKDYCTVTVLCPWARENKIIPIAGPGRGHIEK